MMSDKTRRNLRVVFVLAMTAFALMFVALGFSGCDGDKSTTVNEAPAIDASGKTNGIIIMQDGDGNIAAVYAETEDGSIIPITIDQVGTGNIAIVEIVRPPVIPEPEEP
jgi:hypothetical protein